MDDKKHSYQFNLVRENVAIEDLFEDKTHEKSADLLHKIITTTPNAVTIGLEGGWGSGKSSVVNFLVEKLKTEKNEKYHCFLFDAWAHDDDPLRRIFLERLIESIQAINNNQNKILIDIKEKIVLKKKTVNTKSKKTVTKLGKWLSFSILLLPLATFIITLSSKDFLSSWSNWLLFSGGGIALIPLIILWCWWCFSARDEQGKVRFDIFESDSIEEVDQDITEDNERTSVEFEKYFDQIIQHTMIEEKHFDKLVIVIDNLDRLDADKAKHIWSTLQTFFQHRASSTSSKEWVDRVWFIIPYDREGLERIWEKDNKDDSSNNSAIAKSFIDKSIQLTVEVPNPVMSLWVKYANEQIEFALSDWDKTKQDDIRRRLISFFSDFNTSPTPREINNAINQIGVLGMRYGNTMSPSSIALYALSKQRITTSQMREYLLSKNSNSEQNEKILSEPQQSIIAASNDEIYELAGMLFGVDKNRGAELLIEPEIKKAFNEGNISDLQNIIHNYKEAFQIAWEGSIQSWLPVNDMNEYAMNFIKAVSSINKLIDLIGKDQGERFFSDLKEFVEQSIEKWDFDKVDYSDVINDLGILLNDEGKESLKKISKHTEKYLAKTIKDFTTTQVSYDQTLINIYNTCQQLERNGHAIKTYLYSDLNSENWSKWVLNINRLGFEFKQVLPKKDSITEIIESVGFNNQELDKDHLKSFYHAIKLQPNWINKEVIDNIVQWGMLENREISSEYAESIETYYEILVYLLKKTPKLENKIISLLKSNEFWSAITECDNTPSIQILSAIALYQDENLKIPSCVSSIYWQQELDDNEITNLIEDLVNLDVLGAVWLFARDSNNKLAIQIINLDDERLYSNSYGIRYLDTYSWMSDSLASITNKLCEKGSFLNNKEDMIGSKRIDPYYDVFKILSKHGTSEAKEFVQEQLKNISKEEWVEFLKEGKGFYELLKEKSKNLTDAVYELLEQYINDPSSEFTIEHSKLNELLKKVHDVDNGGFNPIAKIYLETRDDSLPDELFSQLKNIMAQAIKEVNQQELMFKINNWLTVNKFDRINWLLEKGFSPKEQVLERLEQSIKNGLQQKDNNFDTYQKLADLFKITLDIVKDEEVEE